MDKIVRDHTQRRARNAAMGFSMSDRHATQTGRECVHDGCYQPGYDLTEGYCANHYVSNVLTEIEEILSEANENWIATCYAESNAKTIWKCICGFLGTFQERELHFVATNDDERHHPPVSNRLVQVTQTRAKSVKRVARSEGFFDE